MPRHSAYAVTSSILALLLGYTWAARPPAIGQEEKPVHHDIAVVDISKLFNADKEFVAERDKLKGENEEAEKIFKQKQEGLRRLQADAQAAKPNSPEQRRIVEQLQDKATEAETFRREHVQRVMESEKVLNLRTYRVISERIQKYAEEKGIKLIIRYAAQVIDETRTPQEVLALINQDVVYQAGLDVTDEILQTLN
jgi:Skp family chaperone for outer membrane proteins